MTGGGTDSPWVCGISDLSREVPDEMQPRRKHATARKTGHVLVGIALLAAIAGALFAGADNVQAASSAGCEGGGFTLVGLADGTTISGDQDTTVAAGRLGQTFLARGRYHEFVVVSSTFGVRNQAFTGAPNPLDLTGGRRTVIYAEKTPDHRGLTLTSDMTVEISGDDMVLQRTGPGLSMKIQAKDCANGGIFQMEPERGDGTRTLITHVLASGVFYFDNPNFREREGDIVPYKDTTIAVPTRINWANDVSSKFVGRDSSQVATRVQEPGCPNQFVSRVRGPETVFHCGGISRWQVASGGRMGMVTGEDAVEVAPPASDCTHQCQAQNQVRGQAVVLGFPFPVPDSSRLKPRFP